MPRRSMSGDVVGMPVPGWVSPEAWRYIAHTEHGLPIRELARAAGCHASTVLRQIRTLENRRDDLLVDEALRRLGDGTPAPVPGHAPAVAHSRKDGPPMTKHSPSEMSCGGDRLERDAAPILNHLCKPATVLAVAREMDKAVVVRDLPGGETRRLAVVDRPVAQAMALNGWIDCAAPGRVSRYRVTGAGREVCRRAMAEAENRAARGFEEAPIPFVGRPGGAGDAAVPPAQDGGRMRYSAPDSPVAALARRRDRNGRPFLSEALVTAAERLREDCELARMAEPAAGGWESLVTAPPPAVDAREAPGPSAARRRVARALHELG
ncbi:DUF6456 domain-containing protein, partial [Sediminimonas sp.]|uniref:DUF6456 domain-containing protein n=1 Tax=Sediminimonas sp. TaxID=2823379 RepID=UPI0025FDC93E